MYLCEQLVAVQLLLPVAGQGVILLQLDQPETWMQMKTEPERVPRRHRRLVGTSLHPRKLSRGHDNELFRI